MTRPCWLPLWLILFLLCQLLAFTSCVNLPQVAYDKPGVTTAEFAKDSYLCERDLRQSGPFPGDTFSRPHHERAFFNRCLEARGYTVFQVKPGQRK